MKFHWNKSKTRWKDSVTVSFAILTVMQSIAEVVGLFEIERIHSLSWWVRMIIIIALFVVITVLTFIIKMCIAHRGVTYKICNNNVTIREADIFKQSGLRLIPFNERFDTVVDNKIIAHNSLNGRFIDSLTPDQILELNACIENAPEVTGLKPSLNGKTKIHPLGRIITFQDQFLLLAFTHFDDNNTAFLSHSDFEKCLLTMWKEIDRVYANQPVYIPLLGSGITRFVDTPHKDNFSLAQCLLCTLKMSGVFIKQPITICLTPEVMNDINIYELKSNKYDL